MITIYKIEHCPYCKRVEDWVKENIPSVPIKWVLEPSMHDQRKQTIAVSGQSFVPTMKDDETKTVIADDDEEIIQYLKKKFNK
ncbi:MAG: hypothetical protein A2770_04335 [Candidatus Levybacteria bacterium RIFCSPHIGHO2_01_FULL_38_12]|nr:MAG: hypothetical protein A2770_04335 [Candidatus Levybacteria bacterium RIFCSPHIGHO2_01_FULL_38_12]